MFPVLDKFESARGLYTLFCLKMKKKIVLRTKVIYTIEQFFATVKQVRS